MVPVVVSSGAVVKRSVTEVSGRVTGCRKVSGGFVEGVELSVVFEKLVVSFGAISELIRVLTRVGTASVELWTVFRVPRRL